jgi:hypothetical protein
MRKERAQFQLKRPPAVRGDSSSHLDVFGGETPSVVGGGRELVVRHG